MCSGPSMRNTRLVRPPSRVITGVAPAGELRDAEQRRAGLADIVDVVARAHPFSRSIFAS